MSGCFHPQRQRILLYKTLLLSFPPEARWVMGQLSHQLSLFLCLELLLQKFKGFGGTGLKPGVLCMLGKSSTHITPAWPDLFMLGKCNSHFYFIEKKTVGSGQSYFHFSSWINAFTFLLFIFLNRRKATWGFPTITWPSYVLLCNFSCHCLHTKDKGRQ